MWQKFKKWSYKKINLGQNYKCPYECNKKRSVIFSFDNDIFYCMNCRKKGSAEELFNTINKEVDKNV